MEKWECTVCGYIYDPEIGDPEHGVEHGTPFEELPEDWVYPVCGVTKTSLLKKSEEELNWAINALQNVA